MIFRFQETEKAGEPSWAFSCSFDPPNLGEDQESFLLVMYVAREAENPFFRVGYNSLGAFATINHLHFQVSHSQTLVMMISILCSPPTNCAFKAYYLKVQYPVEKVQTKLAVRKSCVSICQLVHYPVRGFAIEDDIRCQV